MWLATSGWFQAQSLTNIPKRFKEQTFAKRKRFSLSKSDKSRTQPLAQTIVNSSINEKAKKNVFMTSWTKNPSRKPLSRLLPSQTKYNYRLPHFFWLCAEVAQR